MARSSGHAPGWWIALVTALTLLAGILLAPDAWLREQVAAERASNQAFFATRTNERIEDRALRWFHRAFVKTGLVDRTYSGLLSQPDTRADPSAEMSGRFNAWAAARADALWVLVMLVVLRLSVAATWLPLLLLVAAGALNDAWVSRKIKTSTFGGTSPHGFHFAQLVVRYVPPVILYLFIAPFHLPASIPPLLILLMGVAAWVAISQFAKRA